MSPKRGPQREGRDDNERDRERKDMAFKLAKKIHDLERKELEAKGYSKEEIDKRLTPIWRKAQFLFATQAKELDKLVQQKKEDLGQAAQKSKKSLSNVGQRAASEVQNAGSRFKDHLQGKRDLKNREKEKNDSKSERKSPSSREPASKRSPAKEEGKEKRNQSDSQSPISVKDLFKGVRELQREKAATPKEPVSPKEQARRKEVEKIPRQPEPSERKEREHRPIRTKAEHDYLKKRHPHVEDMLRWPEIETRSDLYLHVKDIQRRGEVPDKPIREWAKDLGTSYSTLREYLNDWKQPEGFEILDRNEAARKIHEAKLAPEAFEHRIDPSDVYQHFRNLRDVKNPSTEDIATAIENMCKSSTLDSRVQWAELRPYHTGGPQWLKDIAKNIEQNREAVETELNKRLGLENSSEERMRLGVVDNKLYMRRQDISEYNWVNLYRDDIFNFKSLQEKNDFAREARNRLGFQGSYSIGRLIDQVTNREKTVFSEAANNDMYNTIKHLRGFSLGMLLDTNNQRIQDLQPKIEGIGWAKNGVCGIRNPQFPDNKESIDSMFASMFGAGLSDGHIEKSNHGFVFTESNRARVDIFNKQVEKFGDVYRQESTLKNGVIRTRYSSTIGRLLENRGMSSGDKSLKNEGFPDWLKNAPPEAKADYFRPMWAQDGNFKTELNWNGALFQWDRGVVLYDPTKAEKYKHLSDVKPEHISLVRKHGSSQEDELFGSTKKLNGGDLRTLTKHKDPEIARIASELEKIVDANPSQLMKDEQAGLRDFGIDTTSYLAYITYYEGTERLSVLFHCSTNTKEDTMKVAVACPPEDVVKREKVEKWVASEPDLERKVKDDFRTKGFNF